MYYVYILRSINFPDRVYVGYTLNIQSRLNTHNNGGSIYTKDYKPWKLVFYSGFEDKLKAVDFEKYLKSHSGRIFTEKRLV
jgi:putative endonuclease